MADTPNVSQIREELRQHGARLNELANALDGEPMAGTVVLTLVESVARGELWRRTVNDTLEKYITTYFETPHGYDPHGGRFEQCSCGHWRIKK